MLRRGVKISNLAFVRQQFSLHQHLAEKSACRSLPCFRRRSACDSEPVIHQNARTAAVSPFKTRSVCRILNSELKLPPENMVLISPTIDRHKGSQEQSALRFGGYWVPIRL